MPASSGGVPAARVITALDMLDVPAALRLVTALRPLGLEWFKVGLALWIHGGRDVVLAIAARGGRVFLDLKLHDIPHQVRLATRAVASLGVELLTVHAAGGQAMLEAAHEAAHESARGRTQILAITVLTSLPSTREQVLGRVALARRVGIRGVVCSPLEAAAVRGVAASPFLVVTPGVRPSGSAAGDQARVATPEAAIAAGADYLVIGRPITQAPDPVAAARRIIGR